MSGLSEEERLKLEEECRKEAEKNWGYFRNYISAELEYAIYCNSEHATDVGKDLLKGYAESKYDKFLVAFGIRKPPTVSDN